MGQRLCGVDDQQTVQKGSESILEEGENEHCESVLIVTDDQPGVDYKLGVKDFKIVKVIGRGSFGKVMLVKKNDNGKYFAMKSLRKKNLQKKKIILQTKAEKAILQTLNCVFIIKLYYAFQTKQKLYLIMEFVNGGELFFHLRKAKRFSEELIRFYGAEIIVALAYLHKQNILYRDMKPENILLDIDGHIKLTDFGLAKQLGNDKTYTFCGTPEYMAPEILKGEGYSHAADWWTFGAILYEMFVGRPPFYSSDRKKIFKNILENEIKLLPSMSLEAQNLLKKLLNKNWRHRLGVNGADEVQKDPFFVGLDWEEVRNRRLIPPWVPKLTGPQDLTYIDPAFTTEVAKDTPLTKLTLENQSAFQDFSYMNDRSASTEQQPNTSKRLDRQEA